MPLELSRQQSNRLYLKSHFLLENAQQADLVKVIGGICGLNAQTARAAYFSLWARIAGFQKDQLTKTLHEDKRLIKTWLMRGTAHIVPAQDFGIYHKALQGSLSEGWQRQLKKHGLGLPAQKRNRMCQKILDMLAQAPRTKKEMLPEVRHLLRDYAEKEQKIIFSRTLRGLSYLGLVCHGQSTGPWYHFKEHRFARVEDWLPGVDLEEFDEEEAQHELFLRYLHGYGPASVQDFAYWSGFKVTHSRKILEGMKTKLVEVKIKDIKSSFWMLEEDLARLDDTELKEKAPVRFLPEFDPLIMGHKDKSRIMAEEDRKRVFLRLAVVTPVILFDGRVVGTWNFRMTTKSLSTSLFRPLRLKDQDEIKAEAARLTQFFGVQT